jgi:hypothetical protein
MPIIRHHAALRALVAVRGHPFDRSGFDAMFQAMDGVSATMVDQPAAALLMNPEGMRDFDVLVLYDMPGLDFEAAEPPVFVDPPRHCRPVSVRCWSRAKAWSRCTMRWRLGPPGPSITNGLGAVPLSPGQGARRPAPDSGYRHDVAYTASTLPHPVTQGLPHTLPCRTNSIWRRSLPMMSCHC